MDSRLDERCRQVDQRTIQHLECSIPSNNDSLFSYVRLTDWIASKEAPSERGVTRFLAAE
jgi:hypothetical protein